MEVRDFELAKAPDACTGGTWLINGLRWDDIVEYPELGSTEVWRFINRSGMVHPDAHAPGDVPGAGPPAVPPWSTMSSCHDRIPTVPPAPHESGLEGHDPRATRTSWSGSSRSFEDYTGKFAYHCHIIEHEDQEMMRQFEVVDLLR